ncbi:VOC family protein [Flavobacterium sp. NST-5]|uniref:VOC family protein n=1 Tax=Flavobacterium ichthyis TaxID=2698827 RepID=A0ABW9ZBX4_9FLAO|nr:VOC family protein [Flavobacterium ichthyis]NBL65284.1 VOC family protein [Flavobacterium ichthyis]
MKIPENYLPVMPYLILNKANDFFEFAKIVFSAKEQLIVPAENRGIMHGEIKIGDAVIMFAQSTEHWHQKTSGIFLFVENVTETYNLAVKKGSKSLQEPGLQDYGFTAGFEDPFGNQWWINEAEK